MKFTQHYTVKWHDTDANRRVRPSCVLMYMQETANLHLRAAQMDLDLLRDRDGLAFLLSRMTVQQHKPLFSQDEIDVETWICEGQGFGFPRCFRILRGGEVIAEAYSLWALMDLGTQALRRNNSFSYPFAGEEPLELGKSMRFRLPPLQEMPQVGERKIVYSDIDYNGHMNNTHYPDMLCDFTPEMEKKEVKLLQLSYVHEAAYGQTLRVYRTDRENEHCFRTVDGQGNTCLEARLITAEIDEKG